MWAQTRTHLLWPVRGLGILASGRGSFAPMALSWGSECATWCCLHAYMPGMAGQPTAEKEDRMACKHVNRAVLPVLPVLPRALQQ